jgi:C-terminal processing protease CtpA/Prc
VFQDVHEGGTARQAGIKPGDVLLTIDSQEFRPPAAMPFALGRTYECVVRRHDGSTAHAEMIVPGSKDKKRPIVVPDQVVIASRLRNHVGLIRISMFPGVLGMDVARDVSRAIETLQCSRLIIDLRGNTGGGIGCLRVMSLLCPDRRGVGYSHRPRGPTQAAGQRPAAAV